MLQRIAQKLQSQRGASMSMALFLFMMCAVISSVVLAAATAAAGRQSQLEAMDKSYYNVSSAAKVFWDELNSSDACTVTITRECDATLGGEDSFENLANWTASLDGATLSGTLSNTNATLFQLVAYDLAFGSSSASSFSFNEGRVLAQDAIDDAVGTDLEIKEPAVAEATYGTDAQKTTFMVNPAEAGLAAIEVRTVRGKDGSLIFTFAEKDNPSSYTCTLTATLETDDTGVVPTRNGDDYRLRWDTTYRWTASELSLGGA